jgi:hypothetical protein
MHGQQNVKFCLLKLWFCNTNRNSGEDYDNDDDNNNNNYNNNNYYYYFTEI